MKSGMLLFNCAFSTLSSLSIALHLKIQKYSKNDCESDWPSPPRGRPPGICGDQSTVLLADFIKPSPFLVSQRGLLEQIWAHSKSLEQSRAPSPLRHFAMMAADENV